MRSDRAKIAQARQRMIKTAELLKQVPEGASTFSEPEEDGKREILHNGRKTGFYVSENLYLAVMNKVLPTRPKIGVDASKIEDLTPTILQEEFPTVYEFLEATAVYMMVMHDVAADGVEMEVERTAKDTVKWVIRKVQDEDSDTTV